MLPLSRAAFFLALLPAMVARGQSTDVLPVPVDTVAVDTLRTVHRAFLIGDTGGFDPLVDEPVLRGLNAKLRAFGSEASVIFLGDNIYPRGLPDSAATGRALAEARLVQQLDAVKGTGARVFFIPGNHDWDHSGPSGTANMKNQERFVEAYLDQGNTFLPDDGLPGPAIETLAEGVELVVLDTEWWLRVLDKPYGDAGRYETREEGDLLANLADVFRRKDDSRLLVVGHHPMLSNGPHGGRLSLKEHIFPLTELWENAYIPFPLVGSLYPLIRGWSGGKQDMSHPRYRSFRRALMGMFERFENHLVYASGHDHSLQHFPVGSVDYLVSGSASRPKFVSQGRGASFTSRQPGFLEIEYLSDGSSVLRAHSASDVIHEAQLHPPRQSGTDLPRLDPELVPGPTDTLFIGAAAPELEAGAIKEFFLGKAHRDSWTTSVTVPVLDVGSVHGGLKPIQRGGGQQTVSVRLEDPDGHQYALRSLAKDPTKTLPFEFRETVARDIVIDQVSILHPYGALLVPPLAHAIGIYYATPQVFFVPDDPRLEPYADIVGGRVMMLEERPDDDMSHAAQFGNSDDVVGFAKMYSELAEDNDNRVDARFLARNRILDMFISDWDRHEDQWRWATLEPADEKGKWFRAIPRDRDWAFNKMDGLFPNIVQSRYILPKFQEFKREFKFIRGLNGNGLSQDRRLLPALSPSDWSEIADSVVTALSDSVIEESLSKWPEEIRAHQSEEFKEIFQARRSGLAGAVDEYSGLLDRSIDVVMSDKHEEFVVSAVAPDSSRVVVFKTTKEGVRRKVLYDRTFSRNRTREIRLYGMGGNDRFSIPETGSKIYFHVIGGTGDDWFQGSARTPSRVYYYDTVGGMTIVDPGDAQRRLSRNPLVNRYDKHDFKYNSTLATLLIGANEDDGFFIGGGPVISRHSFRKTPYASLNRIRAASSARFQAYTVLYDGHLVDITGLWDLDLEAEIRSPNSIRNFFGLGNETSNVRQNREFYQARLAQYSAFAGLRRGLNPVSFASLGVFVEAHHVREDNGRFVTQAGVSPSTFEDQAHAGARAELTFDSRDSSVMPARGLRWSNRATIHAGLTPDSRTYGRIESRASTYFKSSLASPYVLAFRVGLDHVIGEFPFWDSATLGGTSNLRGWSSTRFAGRTSVFQNLEARVRLTRFAGYLAEGEFGLVGFLDHGRVWTDGESSSLWHRGYGAGLWASVFGAVVLRGSMGVSHEQRHFILGTGFLF